MTSQTPTQSTSTPVANPAREQILVRRRNALLILGGLVVVTLVLAIVTGSVVVLLLNLVADVGLAVYVAYLLQLKQGRGAS